MASGSVPNQKLKDILECTVCKIVTHSKILQCTNGHLTCNRCSARITNCPVCRVPLDPDVDRRTRALSAEQAIDAMNLNFSCRNAECTFSGPKKDIEEHEESCEHNDEYEDVDDSDEDDPIFQLTTDSGSDSDSDSLSEAESITSSEIERLERGISDSELEELRQAMEAMSAADGHGQQ